jgi:hypothetical protein
MCVVLCTLVSFDHCVICVVCLIVVPLPPDENPFAVKINNNNNKIILGVVPCSLLGKGKKKR